MCCFLCVLLLVLGVFWALLVVGCFLGVVVCCLVFDVCLMFLCGRLLFGV